MDASLKQRLVGAAVLVALAVIFLPLLVKGPAPDSGVSDVSLRVPPEPKPADGMVTQDLPLVAPAAAPADGVSGMPMAEPGDVAAEPAPAAATPLAAVAAGDYAVSFGNYANAADADKVIAALQAAGLPGYREAVALAGKQAQRVRIGPFADRAMAESARLRATQVRTDVDTKVVVLDAATPAEAPASAAAPPPEAAPVPKVEAKPAAQAPVAKPEQKPAAKPETPKPAATVAKPEPPVSKPANAAGTGFAVQVGAFADATAAGALRDKLRAAGFNAFTDTVNTDAGRRTRVRVGPAMTRAEADVLKAQVKAKAGIDGMVRPHP